MTVGSSSAWSQERQPSILILFTPNPQATYFIPILTSLLFRRNPPHPGNHQVARRICLPAFEETKKKKNYIYHYFSHLEGELKIELVQFVWRISYYKFVGWLSNITNWKERTKHRTKGQKKTLEIRWMGTFHLFSVVKLMIQYRLSVVK